MQSSSEYNPSQRKITETLSIPPSLSPSDDDKPTGKMVGLASATVKLFSSPASV